MQRKEIATVRLNRGEVGFYDDLTRIHLTIGSPTAKLYSGMNLSRIRRAIRNGVLVLASGTLAEEGKPLKLVKKDSSFVLMKNDSKKKYIPEKKAIATIKTAPDLPAVEENKETHAPDKLANKEENKVVEETIPAVEIEQEEEAKTSFAESIEEKPKKRGRKKKSSSEEEHADAKTATQDESKSEDIYNELS